MALRGTSGPIPEGAIPLTLDEAVDYQWNQVRYWKSKWDVWPVLYGVPMLSFFAGFSGLKINKHYRMKLKLRTFGLASTSLTMGLTPVIFTTISHYFLVTHELFVDRQCLLCLQTRAACIQILTSTVYPIVMSPIANFVFATRHGTYRLPYWADYKGTIKLWLTMNKSLAPKMTIMIPMQIIAAYFMTYMQARNLGIIKAKIENGEVDDVPRHFS